MGTSAPEAAVSLTAAFHGNADITIGNVVGSNIMNVLVILGLAAMICPMVVAKLTVFVDYLEWPLHVCPRIFLASGTVAGRRSEGHCHASAGHRLALCGEKKAAIYEQVAKFAVFCSSCIIHGNLTD